MEDALGRGQLAALVLAKLRREKFGASANVVAKVRLEELASAPRKARVEKRARPLEREPVAALAHRLVILANSKKRRRVEWAAVEGKAQRLLLALRQSTCRG